MLEESRRECVDLDRACVGTKVAGLRRGDVDGEERVEFGSWLGAGLVLS
jgi:hypothetical protein